MYSYAYPHPAVTTDIVIFSIRDEALKVLLIKRAGKPYKGKWALPGGFVREDEDLDTSALRELEEETGVRDVYLEQLYTFGEPQRDPRERVITVAYYALIASDQVSLCAATDAEAVGWFGLDETPLLAFDHAGIIAMANERLIAKRDYTTKAFHFLPENFSLTKMQADYEVILGDEI